MQVRILSQNILIFISKFLILLFVFPIEEFYTSLNPNCPVGGAHCAIAKNRNCNNFWSNYCMNLIFSTWFYSIDLHICAKFCYVARSQSYGRYIKNGQIRSKFLAWRNLNYVKAAIIFKNFIFHFRNSKENAKIPSRSKVIDIWKK